MSLRQLFRGVHNAYCINRDPQLKIKRLMKSYNMTDWKNKAKHQDLWFNNPIIHNGQEIDKPNQHIKTPVFFNEFPHFDMFIIGYPGLFKTTIHHHTNSDCFVKVLDGSITEHRYRLSKLSRESRLHDNEESITNIVHVKSGEFHTIKNNLEIPTYTLNIYSKK